VHTDQQNTPVSQKARIPLVELLAMPKSNYLGFDGQPHELPIKPGRLLLINLWASWCPICQEEMKEFTEGHEKLNAAGVDILALSIEGLSASDPAGARENAIRAASRGRFPYTTGFATPRLLSALRELHKLHIPLDTQLPLPSSFLIDRQGRVSMIYKGSVTVDQLLKDANYSDLSRLERFKAAAPIAGRSLEHPQVTNTAANTSEFIRFHYALFLEQSGRAEQAIKEYAEVLKTKPDSHLVHNNLGKLMQQLRRYEESRKHFKQALLCKPDYTIAHNNLGILLQKLGEYTEAIVCHREAIRIDPNYANAHNSLANALGKRRQTAEAIKHYRYALRIRPDFAAAHTNLANTLLRQGKRGEAIKHLRHALRANTNDSMAHVRLAVALGIHGNAPEAVKHYDKALELNPNHQQALNDLARIRATHPDEKLRDGKQALALAKKCCALSQHRVSAALDTLAAAFAETGQFDDAVKWQNRAIELARRHEMAAQVARLQLYKKGVPYREGHSK